MFVLKSIEKVELKENFLVVNGKELNFGALTEDDKEVLNTMISKGAKYLPLLYLNNKYILESIDGKKLNKIEYLSYLLECKRIKKAGVKESNTKLRPLTNVGNLEILEGDNNICFGKEGKIFTEASNYEELRKYRMDNDDDLIIIRKNGEVIAKGMVDDLKDNWEDFEDFTFDEETKKYVCEYNGDTYTVEKIIVEAVNPDRAAVDDPALNAEEEEELNALYDRKIKGYVCPTCGKVIPNILDWGRAHYKEFGNEYTCPYCGDVFTFKTVKDSAIFEGVEEPEDITWFFDRYDWEIAPTTEEQLGMDYSYHKLVKSVDEAKEFNYHSDYWGSADQYQSDAVSVMEDLEPYVGKDVKVYFDDGTGQLFNVKGLLIDKQYNSLGHLHILVDDKGTLKESNKNIKRSLLRESEDNIREVSPEELNAFLDTWENGDRESLEGEKLICFNGDEIIAVNNSDGYAMIETFDKKDEGYARGWLNGKVDYEDFKLLKKRVNESVEENFKDMVMELHSYVEANPKDISIGLKKAIQDNKLEDYLRQKAAMTDEEIEDFKSRYLKEAETPKQINNDFIKANGEKIRPDSEEYTKSLNDYMTKNGELGGKQGDLLVYNTDEDAFYTAKQKHDEEYLKNIKESLKESSNNNVVKAYIDLSSSLHDGMGDMDGNLEFAEILADDYNIKYNREEGLTFGDVFNIIEKGMSKAFKEAPKEFKNYVESLIVDECLDWGFDYITEKIHKEPNLKNDLIVIQDYLVKNGGDKKAIEGIKEMLGQLDNVAVDSRNVAEELCDYLNHKTDIWKILGTNARFWANGGVIYLPKGYTCMVGEDFNYLLFKDTYDLSGIAYLFKDNKDAVVAELFTFGYNKDKFDNHNAIYMDNFKSLGDTFTITEENKKKVFKQMGDRFKEVANQLKADNLKTFNEYSKYKLHPRKNKEEYAKEYEKEKKKYLSSIEGSRGTKVEGVNPNRVSKECPMCDKTFYMELTDEEYAKYQEYLKGGIKIQDAFPEMLPVEREFLKSGYCPDCQELLFASENTSDRIKEFINEDIGTQVGDIAPEEDYIKPMVKPNRKAKKKIVKEATEDEIKNAKAKILDWEDTGGHCLAFLGEVDDYCFVVGDDGPYSVAFYSKENGFKTWEDYEENWDTKPQVPVDPDFFPAIGKAIVGLSKTIKNPIYADHVEEIGKLLLGYKLEESLKESANNLEIEYATPNYTGGGIYVYTGKLKDGNYFMASDDWFDKDNPYFTIRIVNENPDEAGDDGYDAWYEEWQKPRLVRDITDDEAKRFTEQILKWIIKNKPEGNYQVDDMKDLLKVMKPKNIKESVETYTDEEKAEYGLDNEGYDENGDKWIHCQWCGELVPVSECRKELNLGWICDGCQRALYSRGEKAVYADGADYLEEATNLKVGDKISFYANGYKSNGKFSNKGDIKMNTEVTKVHDNGAVSAKDPQGVKSFDYISPEEITSVNGKNDPKLDYFAQVYYSHDNGDHDHKWTKKEIKNWVEDEVNINGNDLFSLDKETLNMLYQFQHELYQADKEEGLI